MQRKNTSLGAGDAEALQESSLALKIPKITATSRSAQERRARPRRMATPDVARRTSAAARAEPAARPSPLAVIRRSMDLLPERFKVVTATVDVDAGEIGTIYQACGFDYVGVMRPGGRALTRVNGKTLSERQMHRLTGTRGARALTRLGFDAIPVPRRARYFAFRGDKRERTRNRAAIGHLIMNHPRRFYSATKDQQP